MPRTPSSETPATAVGAAAGSVATIVMSAVMLAAQKAGFEGEQPPEAIVETGLDRAGVRRSERTEHAVASVAHLGFGASCGAVYALLRHRLRMPGPEALHGAGFGLAVYAASYAGWIPALAILPPPRQDSDGRQGTMIVAHLVYGTVLGSLAGRWRR